MSNYYFTDITFKVKNRKLDGGEEIQLMIKEKDNHHHFSCRNGSIVEIGFESRRGPSIKVIIDFELMYIECVTANMEHEIQAIIESIYIGNNQQFICFKR